MKNNEENQVDLEGQYRAKFSELKDCLTGQLQNFLSEAIIDRQFESPSLKAEVAVYRPIVESIIQSLKASGILNSKKNDVPSDEIVTVITEQTEVIKDQTKKIKELQMKIKLHEMISNNLSGLSKEIIREAITKFQGEDEIPEDELLKKLTSFVNTRKPESKTIQFESINSEIDEVSSILEGTTSNKGKFNPKTKINFPGIKPRVVTESAEVTMPEDQEITPADEFMRDFSHLG